MINFKPVGGWLSVSFRPPITRSKSGLYLATPQYSQIATVLAVGDQVKHVKSGDLVMMHLHGDAMQTQKSLWYHYFTALRENKPVDDFKSPPVIITEDDVFGLWDDVLGLIPHKNNLVLSEHLIPSKVNGVIRVLRHRQDREPICDVIKVSPNVKHFTSGQTVLLGKYGGVYFKDIDDKEKVLASANEVLGIFTKKVNKVLVKEPREHYDPKIGAELYSQ